VRREQDSREIEGERVCVCKHCCKRVLASAINLTIGQIFMTARERIILDLSRWRQSLSLMILVALFLVSFSSAVFTWTFHSTDKSPMCHTGREVLLRINPNYFRFYF